MNTKTTSDRSNLEKVIQTVSEPNDFKAILDLTIGTAIFYNVMRMLARVQDDDQAFVRARAQSRREDYAAMSTGKVSPTELQAKNSILPDDFWNKAKVDWNALAVETRSHS